MLAGVLHTRAKKRLHNGGPLGFYSSFNRLLLISSEEQILRKVGPTSDHLANKFLARPIHHHHDAVSTVAQGVRSLQFPVGINGRHLHRPLLRTHLKLSLIAWRGKDFSNAFAGAIA